MGNPPRFHELTDMPDNGASTSAAAGMFTRQVRFLEVSRKWRSAKHFSRRKYYNNAPKSSPEKNAKQNIMMTEFTEKVEAATQLN